MSPHRKPGINREGQAAVIAVIALGKRVSFELPPSGGRGTSSETREISRGRRDAFSGTGETSKAIMESCGTKPGELDMPSVKKTQITVTAGPQLSSNEVLLGRITAKVTIENREFLFLADTGSPITFMGQEAFIKLRARSLSKPQTVVPVDLNGNPIAIEGKTFSEIEVCNVQGRTDIYVSPTSFFGYDGILGLDAMDNLDLILIPKAKALIQNPGLKLTPTQNPEVNTGALGGPVTNLKKPDYRIPDSSSRPPDEEQEVHHTRSDSPLEVILPGRDRKFNPDDLERLVTSAPIEAQTRLREILEKNKEAFSKGPWDIGNALHCPAHEINTGNNPPINCRPYRIPYSQREAADKCIQEMLERDIIMEAPESPFNSPILLVPKKDGSVRLCNDFRKLNQQTVPDVYPVPSIQDIFDRLKGHHYFSILDFRSAFYQLNLTPESSLKTAFSYNDRLYCYTRVPFGVRNGPSSWQRAINTALKGLETISLAYADDVLVFGKNLLEHLSNMERVLKAITKAGLKLQIKKCSLLKTQVVYLGHKISNQGLYPDPEKLEAVKNYPRPTSIKQLQALLGCFNYYRRFVPRFAEIVFPLTDLLRTKRSGEGQPCSLRWTDEAEDSFLRIKNTLVSAPILRYPDTKKPWILHTDASSKAIGAVLSQIHENEEHPCGYISRRLSPAEENYSIVELECLAIIYATKQFHTYIYGSPCSLVTDNKAISWLWNLKEKNPRLLRWSIQLQNYDLFPSHRTSKENANADALTRCYATIGRLVPSIDYTKLREYQRKDPGMKNTIQDLVDHKPSEFYLIGDNGVLYKRERKSGGEKLLALIPNSLVKDIIRLYHDTPLGGHQGSERTYQNLREKCFFPNMSDKISEYVKRCERCAKAKKTGITPVADIIPIRAVQSLFEKTGIDVLGPITSSIPDNYKYIMTFTCYLTKFAVAVPLTSINAQETSAKFTHEIVFKYGAPRSLISDRGSNFMSEVFRNTCELLGIDRLHTTSYHPATNGLVERFNGTLANLLRASLPDNRLHEWPSVLPAILFAYNSTKHPVTKFSPFYLMHGRIPNDSLANLKPAGVMYDDNPSFDKALHRQLLRARKLASSNIAEEAEKMKETAHSTKHEIKVGEIVLLKREVFPLGKPKKLHDRYLGPYRVTRKTSPVNVIITEMGGGNKTIHTHVNRLKKFRPRENNLESLDVPDVYQEQNEEAPIRERCVEEEGEEEPNSNTYPGHENVQMPREIPYALRSKGPVKTLPKIMTRAIEHIRRRNQNISPERVADTSPEHFRTPVEARNEGTPPPLQGTPLRARQRSEPTP